MSVAAIRLARAACRAVVGQLGGGANPKVDRVVLLQLRRPLLPPAPIGNSGACQVLGA